MVFSLKSSQLEEVTMRLTLSFRQRPTQNLQFPHACILTWAPKEVEKVMYPSKEIELQ